MSKQRRQNITMLYSVVTCNIFWHKKPHRLGGKNNLINLLLFLSTSDSGYNQSSENQNGIVYHLPRIRKNISVKNIRKDIEERWGKTSQKSLLIKVHIF